jgi:hypothetical protein
MCGAMLYDVCGRVMYELLECAWQGSVAGLCSMKVGYFVSRAGSGRVPVSAWRFKRPASSVSACVRGRLKHSWICYSCGAGWPLTRYSTAVASFRSCKTISGC